MYKLQSILTIALALLLGSLSLKAQIDPPAAPTNLEAELQVAESYPEQYFAALTWEHELEFTRDEISLDTYFFMVYYKQGTIGDKKPFELFETLLPFQCLEFDEFGNPSDYFSYNMPLKKAGDYVFYVTMVKFSEEAGFPIESKPSNFATLDANEIIEYPDIRFVIDDEMQYEFVVGEESTIQFKAVTDEENCPINYEIAYISFNGEYELDSETGLFTFTPERQGWGYIEISAELTCYPGIRTHYGTDLIFTFTPCASISGKITFDKELEPDESGMLPYIWITAYDLVDDYTDDEYGYEVFQSQVNAETGEYSLELTEGEYVLQVNGRRIQKEGNWYDNASNFEDATKVVVKCEDNLTLDFGVQVKSPPSITTINGRTISSVTGEGIQTELFFVPAGIFFGDEYYDLHEYYEEMLTFTDAEGNFEVQLYEEIEYIAMAIAMDGRPDPQFYNATFDLMSAERFTADEFKDDIMIFELIEPRTFSNSISGNISNENGEPIPSKVAAFLVEPDESGEYGMYEFVKSTVADEEGNYQVSNLYPGDYIVMSAPMDDEYTSGYYAGENSAIGNWKDAKTIDVEDDSNISNINFVHERMTPEEQGIASIEGNVYEIGNAENKHISGVMVSLVNSSGRVISQSMSDNNGHYIFEDLPAGTFSIQAGKVGYTEFNENFVTDYAENYDIDRDIFLTKESVSSVRDINESANNISIFPNPAEMNTNIDLSGINGEVTINIYNASGELVETLTSNSTSTININTSEFAVGSYFVRFSNGNNIYSGNFSVVR